MRTFCYQNQLVDPSADANPDEATITTMRAHFAYLKDALAAGQLVLAGPCEDLAFGLVIFQAEDDSAARAFMANDPAICAGLMTAELHPFRVSLIAGRLA